MTSLNTTISTLALCSLAAISALPNACTSSLNCYPIVEYVDDYSPNTGSLDIVVDYSCNLGEILKPVFELFMSARNFTNEEKVLYEDSILSMYKKTDERLIL